MGIEDLRTRIEDVLDVSEVDADRGGRRCRAWTVGRRPWTVGLGVGPFGRAVLSCAELCSASRGRWGRCRAESCVAVVDVRGSRMSRRRVLGCWGRRGKVWDQVVGGWAKQKQEREQKLRLWLPCGEVRCGRCSQSKRAGCCSYRRDFRQSTGATVDSQQVGMKGLQWGIKRKRLGRWGV